MPLYYAKTALRDSAVLTNSYVAATVLGPKGVSVQADPVMNNQLLLYIDFTLGSLTTASVKVEFSDDGVTYSQETGSSLVSGVSTETLESHLLSATGKYRLAIPIADRYIKVSAVGTGTSEK